MKCSPITLPGGSVLILCGRAAGKRGRQLCRVDGMREATLLCDWPMGGGRTCDTPLCEEHAAKIGSDSHLCPEHARSWRGEP